MKKFVLVLICGIALSTGHPLDNQQNLRYARQTPQSYRQNNYRQRLKNFPDVPYQMQVIDYPGGTYGYQPDETQFESQPPQNQHFANNAPLNTQFDSQPIHQFPTAPTVPFTIPTTPLPIIVDEQEPVEQYVQAAPVPAIRTPAPRRRVNSHPRVQPVQERFQGQDFVDDEILPQQQQQRVRPVAPREETEEERLLRLEQAKSAHYSFGTSIDDRINDQNIQRQETRDGLALRGMYSYSDGFFSRTIHYEADENGYRVVKEEIEPIGDGPQYDPNGTADVSANLHNSQIDYSITADDFARAKQNKNVSNNRQSQNI